jgi:hypothetical protein
MSLDQAIASVIKDNLKPMAFASGSKGFHATDKISVDGVRYQAQAHAVLIGSKAKPKVKIQAKRDEAVAALSSFASEGLQPKVFKSGKRGYYASGKAEIGGQRYQVQAQAVRLA